MRKAKNEAKLKKALDTAEKAIRVAVGDNAFINMVAGLGTIRDKQTAGEFVAEKRKSVQALNTIYEADWIAERIINKPAYDAMRAGWYYSNLDEDELNIIKSASKDLKLNRVILRALSLSRLHGWSYILIGANDGDLAEPLDVTAGDIQFLTVLDRDQCSEYEEGGYLSAVIAQGAYDEPEFYNIGDRYAPKLVHHSRVIRVDAPDPIGGCKDGKPMPVLQRIHDVLKRTASVNSNASSLVYESKIDVIKTPHLLNQLSSGLGGAVSQMMKHYASIATLKGNNGMIVLDKEEEYDSKSYSFGGLPELMREFSVQTAGAANIPYTLLFGQSPGGLNSTGDFDIRAYYDNISIHQEHTLRDVIEELAGLILEANGIDGDDIGLVFNPLWQLDDKTRSEVERNNAERDARYVELGVITESQVARQLVDDGTYTVIDEQHINLLEGMAGAYEYRDVDSLDGAGL